MNETRLKELRLKIDSIDDSIIKMLRERVAVAREIGEAKGSRPVYDPEREMAVIRRLQDLAPDIDGEALASVYTDVIALCRSVQMKKTGQEDHPPL